MMKLISRRLKTTARCHRKKKKWHYWSPKSLVYYVYRKRQTVKWNTCNSVFSSSFFSLPMLIYIHLDKRESSWVETRLRLYNTIFTSLLIIVSFLCHIITISAVKYICFLFYIHICTHTIVYWWQEKDYFCFLFIFSSEKQNIFILIRFFGNSRMREKKFINFLVNLKRKKK